MSLLQPDQPLFLPKGSVRAILALIITVVVAYLIVKAAPSLTGEQVMTLAVLVLGAYFITKSATSTLNS